MKKYLPALLAAILSGMLINSTYAAEQGDVDDVTMDVINNSDPHTVTNDIQLPDEASQEARDHLSGTVDDSDHAQNAQDDKSESQDSATEDASDDAHAAAAEDAQEDSQDAAQEQADQAMQDSADTSTTSGN